MHFRPSPSYLDDRPRTCDLCRDCEKEGRNLQKTSVTDSFFWRCKERSGAVIEPISNPRPLPCKPLPTRRESGRLKFRTKAEEMSVPVSRSARKHEGALNARVCNWKHCDWLDLGEQVCQIR